MIMCVLLCYPVSIHMSQLQATGRPISSLHHVCVWVTQFSLKLLVVVDQFTPGYQFTPTPKFIQNNHS